MFYFSVANTEKLIEAINSEARRLGIKLVIHELDRRYDYNVHDYQDLESITDKIVGDIRDWFSGNNFNKKEMSVSIRISPLQGEFVCVQTRCKR